MKFSKKYIPYYFLLVAVVFGFWQITFLKHSLKWDAIDVVFPFRFYFSECIQSGYFPFWNPYQQTGTPFFADLQVPTFYPELLFTSLFSGYGIYTVNFLFVGYLFIAAVGMYNLSFHFNKSQLASVFAGIAYSFSGYIIGHGQHFFLLVGAAWIPFVIVNYLKLNEKRDSVQVLKTTVFIFLMITGAYQALSFVLFYLLLFLFIYFIIKAALRKKINEIIGLIKINFLLAVMIVVISLPLIFNTFEILNSVERLETGVNFGQVIESGQNIKSVISFLLPFPTLKNADFFDNVDVSMRNHYFGIIPLLFCFAALYQKRSVLEYIILVFGLIIFASSFSFLPVSEFMFRYILFMNLFKYMAYVRIFGLLGFILIAANYFAYFQSNINKEKKRIIAFIISLMFILLFLILYSGNKILGKGFENILSLNDYSGLTEKLTFHQHVFLQAIFQLFICTSLLLIIFFYKKIKYPVHGLIVLFVIEIFTASQLNLNTTVTDSSHVPYKMKKDLSLYPEKFPIPVDCKVIYNDQKHAAFPPFWRNTYIFLKQISFNAFSSFELDSYNKLDDLYLNLRDAVLNNHLFYFSETIHPISQFADSLIDIETCSKHLYFTDEDFVILSEKNVATDSTDQIRILKFSPNEIIVESSTKNDQFLTVLQTNFKGWEAYIDDNKTNIYTSNFNYRTIFLPLGKHTVRYTFRNNKILILYIISNALFFSIVLYLIGYFFWKNNHRTVSIVIPLILLLVSGSFLIKRLMYKDHNLNIYQIYDNRWSDKKPFFQYSKDIYKDIQRSRPSSSDLTKESIDIKSDNEYFNICEIPINTKKLKEGTLVFASQLFPKSYVEGLIVSEVSDGHSTKQWQAGKIERQIENLNKWNNIIYLRNFYDLKEGDIIKLYVWNMKHKNFKIDDINVAFYPL